MILSVLKIFFNLVGNTDIKSTEVKHHKLWNEKFSFKGITHTHTHTHTHAHGLNFGIISVMCQQFFLSVREFV